MYALFGDTPRIIRHCNFCNVISVTRWCFIFLHELITQAIMIVDDDSRLINSLSDQKYILFGEREKNRLSIQRKDN